MDEDTVAANGGSGNDDEGSSQYLPGAAALLESIDKVVTLVLRDGRHLVGKLRSFDQYLNLMLEDAHERVLLPGKYCDVPLGFYIVRGDTIVLLGEIDGDKERSMKLEKISVEEFGTLVEEQEPDKIIWDFME